MVLINFKICLFFCFVFINLNSFLKFLVLKFYGMVVLFLFVNIIKRLSLSNFNFLVLNYLRWFDYKIFIVCIFMFCLIFYWFVKMCFFIVGIFIRIYY